jgi:hypothetical protein
MKKNTGKFLLSLGLLFLASNISLAEQKKAAPKKVVPSSREEGDYVIEKRRDGSTVKYKKKTQYDFEGANVEGIYNKPSGSYISNIKDVKARSIIRVRENFDSEVIDSSRSVK